MKNLLLITIALFTFSIAFSQKPYKEKASFDYMRLALHPLPSEIKNYTSEVVLTYKERVTGERAAMQSAIDAAIEQNAQAKADYDSKSFGEKLGNKALLGKRGPELVAVPTDNTYYSIIHNESAFAGTYLKINGYGSAAGNAVKITAYMDGFEYSVEEKTGNKSLKKDGATVVVTTYYYNVTYKHPVKLKVETESLGVITEDYVEGTNKQLMSQTKTYESRAALQKYWDTGKNGFLSTLDNKSAKLSMEVTKEELNSLYGVTKVQRNIQIWLVKGKKFDYTDYQNAYESAVTGYGKLANEGSNQQAFAEIKKAIEKWEKALKESEPKNKKARINDKVTAATHLNLVEAYIWINDFTNASLHLNKTKFLDLNKFTRLAKKQKELVEDQKTRFEANK